MCTHYYCKQTAARIVLGRTDIADVFTCEKCGCHQESIGHPGYCLNCNYKISMNEEVGNNHAEGEENV